jgi:tRNA G18 (ribose-2'-O)-methylase SpoU
MLRGARPCSYAAVLAPSSPFVGSAPLQKSVIVGNSRRLGRRARDQSLLFGLEENSTPNNIGASPQATSDYRAVRYEKPLVILVGSEKLGLSDEFSQAYNALVCTLIPRRGVDSVNIAVAAGILLLRGELSPEKLFQS